MDVAVSELRAHLGKWIDEVRHGSDVVITDRGVPVARIVALDASPTIERLVSEGMIRRPRRSQRPSAGVRPRPAPAQSVADIVSDHRGV